MKPRQQRMLAVGLVAVGLAIAATFSLRAFKDNMMFFVEISDVMAGNYPKERNFRIGGLVVAGTVEREEGSLDMSFMVTDTRCALPVSYSGVVPDQEASHDCPHETDHGEARRGIHGTGGRGVDRQARPGPDGKRAEPVSGVQSK